MDNIILDYLCSFSMSCTYLCLVLPCLLLVFYVWCGSYKLLATLPLPGAFSLVCIKKIYTSCSRLEEHGNELAELHSYYAIRVVVTKDAKEMKCVVLILCICVCNAVFVLHCCSGTSVSSSKIIASLVPRAQPQLSVARKVRKCGGGL